MEFEIKDGVLLKYTGNDTKIVIPDTVTSIGYEVFLENESITSVIMPDSVVSIQEAGFADCINLVEVKLSNSLKTIKKDAFTGCVNLPKLELPDSLVLIGEEAFCFCEKLVTTIPKSVTFIVFWAFYQCEMLPEETVKQIQALNSDGFK